jgi:hypothetical protein
MKKFDAIKMVREIRDRNYTEIKEMKLNELVNYFKENAKWTSQTVKNRSEINK